MPELPEVETIRRSLKILEGQQIRKITFSKLAPLEHTHAQFLQKQLHHRLITSLKRRGKYLLLPDKTGASLVIHLGMSGRLLYFKEKPIQNPKHTHMQIDFVSGATLIFIDPRRFGSLSFTQSLDGQDNPFLKRLGPDYLDPNFQTKDYILQARKHAGLSLKALTLHQGIATGLGNIYACEALYYAKLNPQRLVRNTSDQELGRLLKASRHVLNLGIQHGGSSLRDYYDGLGNRGMMKDFLQVYDREGQKTLDGKGMVRRIVQNARSTWFCPEVQN